VDAGRLVYVVREAQLTLLQHRRLHAIAVLILSVAVAILTLFLLVMFNTRLVLQELGAQAKVIVFLDDAIQSEQRQAIETALNSIAGLQAVRYISKAQAWQDFTSWFPESPQLVEGLDLNPLPASYVVNLAPDAQSDTVLHTLQQRLSRLAGIDEVEYGTKWRRGFRTVLQGVRWVSLVGGVALGVGIVFIMANTMRLTLYTRLHDIEIMQLVGATERFISGPFILIGMLQGLVGAVIGLGLLFGLYHTVLSALGEWLSEIIGPHPFRFLPWQAIGATVVGGLVLGCLGSALALNRMLRLLQVGGMPS
jgi:cell division transport system permease protein